jgi:acetate---CoA ligase (ADP-forming)
LSVIRWRVELEESMTKRSIFAELDPMFHPRSVALIGASGKPGKVGRVLMDRFLETGFQEFYPVNPAEQEILGVKAYRAINDIPGPVDMAIVLTPTDATLTAVEECAAKGVKTIVITSAGFGETSPKGKELEQEMVRAARQGGARIIGPNCVGIFCPASRLPYPLPAPFQSGSVGVISQSGFFADYLTQVASSNGIGFSKAISCGNESDLTATDFLEYLGEDPETKLIIGYLEGIKDGKRFHALIQEISREKPIILWKGGRTEAGARAAVSHTGAMAGSGAVWEGVFRQAGVISVKSFEEALDCLYAFHLQPLPKGRRVGIVSGPGGTAVGTTDMCLDLGLAVPRFSRRARERLRETLPPVINAINNPVDLTLASLVTPRVTGDAIRILLEEESVDMLLVVAVIGGELLRGIIAEAIAASEKKKPVVVTIMAENMQSVVQDVPLFLRSGISVYSDAARAAKALARLVERAQFRARRRGALRDETVRRRSEKAKRARDLDVITKALQEGRTTLSEHESKACLRAYGIPVTKESEVRDGRTFREALARIGFPCVVKASGPAVSHKTERGLVCLDIRTKQEAINAFTQIKKRAGANSGSILVQEMVHGARELMIGLTRDAQFGPCVTFGLGGIFTEVLKDISLRVAPITKRDALEMIEEARARHLLGAYRGMPAADIDKLAEILVRVGEMGMEQAHIKEIDINPIIVSGTKPVAVDALVVLE